MMGCESDGKAPRNALGFWRLAHNTGARVRRTEAGRLSVREPALRSRAPKVDRVTKRQTVGDRAEPCKYIHIKECICKEITLLEERLHAMPSGMNGFLPQDQIPDATEVSRLAIPPRARNILLNMGITTAAQLRRLTRDRFMVEWRAGERLWEQVSPFTAEKDETTADCASASAAKP